MYITEQNLVHFTTLYLYFMNQVTHEQKDSVTKTLAIIGFIVAVLFIVWLVIQIVHFIPSAFNSLASIADGVYNYNEEQTMSVSTKNSVVNTGESFALSWTELKQPGTYTFMYECTPGTSVQVRTAQGNIIDLDCDTPFILGDKTSLEIIVDSEKQRFTDIPYTVTHTPKNPNLDVTQTHSQVTIVNASIPTGTTVAEDDETSEEEAVKETIEKEETAAVETPSSPAVTPKPKVVQTPIYEIPTSDPNGDIDLAVTYLGVGTLEGKVFSKSGTIDADKQGAIRFEVKNIGTKTADDWGYEAQLPSGITYVSGKQEALKPNEKAIITLGFKGLTETGIERFGVTVDAEDDVNTKNNSFTWAVEVVE